MKKPKVKVKPFSYDEINIYGKEVMLYSVDLGARVSVSDEFQELLDKVYQIGRETATEEIKTNIEKLLI